MRLLKNLKYSALRAVKRLLDEDEQPIPAAKPMSDADFQAHLDEHHYYLKGRALHQHPENMFPQGTPEQEEQAQILAGKLKTAFMKACPGHIPYIDSLIDDKMLSVARKMLATPAIVVTASPSTLKPGA